MRQGNLATYAWSNAPGDEYPPHAQSFNKVIYVVSGTSVWDLPATGERIEMHPGDRFELPREVVHATQVGPKGVTCPEGRF